MAPSRPRSLVQRFPRPRRSLIAVTALLVISGLSNVTVAQEFTRSAAADDAPAMTLDPVTVVATRQPRSLSEVAGTISILGRDRIERDVALDLQDLIRYEPGVEVDGGGTRFGFGGFRIRGIGGNRTAVVIDNVPAADRFSVGNFADSGRGLLELGLVGRVEILRGPASTLYGSKALGGVVAISLLDAPDLLFGADQGTRIELAGGSDNERLRLTAAHARRRGDWSGLLAASAQQASEIDVAARPTAVDRDRLDRDQRAFLLRLARDTVGGRLRLTLDGLDEDRDSDLRALLGTGRFATTTSLFGDDRREQFRVLLDQELGPLGPIARGQWRVWHQRTDTRQDSAESRPLARSPVDLFRRFDFEQHQSGLGADLESEVTLAGRNHRIGFGFELVRSELEQQRFATQTNLNTGLTSTTVLGERFPLRDFPNTRVTEAGFYLFDEFRLWHGGPSLSPGLRYEVYRLDSRPDPLFSSAFPDAEVVDVDETAWAPRLGLVWPLATGFEAFVQYARGFRSPPFEDVNIGLDIPMFGIRAIPNPALKPERGDTVEAGLRYRTPETGIDLAVYRNRFRDFIETRAVLGFDPIDQVLLFQSINRDRVEIEGAELRLRQRLTRRFDLELSAEWSRGEDRDSGRSLSGISPPRGIAALAWTPVSEFELRLVTTATRAQRRLVDEQDEVLFSAPGSTVFDLTGRWQLGPEWTLNFGLFNLDDRRWFNNAAVLNRPPDDPVLPLLAEPGRHVRASLNLRF